MKTTTAVPEDGKKTAQGELDVLGAIPGTLPGTVVCDRDLADSRKKEESAWLASFPELHPHPIVELDLLNTTICYTNPAAKTLLAELTPLGFDHPWLSGWNVIADQLRNHASQRMEREVTLATTTYQQTWHLAHNGQRLRIYWIDISERKLIEHLNLKINLIDKYIHSTLNPAGIMRRTLAQAADAIRAQTAVISLRQDDGWIVSHVHGLPKELVGNWIDSQDEHHVLLAIENKRTLAIDDAFNDERTNQEHMKKWCVRSVLVAPLIIKEEVVGVVFFNYHQAPFAFHASHINFASQLAAKLALALDNARLFGNLEKELNERRRAEDELQRLNRTLKALSDSNFAMMRATDESSYLEQVCNIIVQDCGHAMAWIGYADEADARCVRPVAHAGFVEGYLETVTISWDDDSLGRGPIGTAVRTGLPCHCRNVRTDPNFIPWRKQATQRGYASILSLPLIDHKKVFGAISIYSTLTNAFSDDEVSLLTELANSLSRGLTDLRLRVAHQRAQEDLKASEQRVRLKLDSILSPEGNIGNLELADILDADDMQSLLGDFYKLSKIPISVVDLKGNVLVSVGWQEVCVKFHRAHPETSQFCRESDEELSSFRPEGKFGLVKCKNHLWDAATPIIVAGHRMGNLFSGQFLFTDEALDLEIFREHAKKYNFCEKGYLSAIQQVPRLTKESLDIAMNFLTKLADLISKLSYSNIKLARTLAERNNLMESLSTAKTQLEKVNQDLEERVQERTAKLHEAIGELEHFSYTITHDMRAPLRAMRGYGDILLEQNAGMPPESKQFIARINSAAGRMDNLITDALHYSKLVRQEVTLLPTDCEQLLMEMIHCYPQYQKVKSSIRIEGKIPMIMGNEAALTQCFSNLLNNAIKFIEPGQTPQIRIWAEEKGARIRIWFQDNGIGIPKECQQRIFLMFQRVNPTYEGTGIGLALVHKASERMGGRVGVDSEVGKGSNFWLELNKAPTAEEKAV